MPADEMAFPVPAVPWMNNFVPGLTKRELFAAMAMQGFLADPSYRESLKMLAFDAVVAADALLHELSRSQI